MANELSRIVTAWPSLSAEARLAVLDFIDEAANNAMGGER